MATLRILALRLITSRGKATLSAVPEAGSPACRAVPTTYAAVPVSMALVAAKRSRADRSHEMSRRIRVRFAPTAAPTIAVTSARSPAVALNPSHAPMRAPPIAARIPRSWSWRTSRGAPRPGRSRGRSAGRPREPPAARCRAGRWASSSGRSGRRGTSRPGRGRSGTATAAPRSPCGRSAPRLCTRRAIQSSESTVDAARDRPSRRGRSWRSPCA